MPVRAFQGPNKITAIERDLKLVHSSPRQKGRRLTAIFWVRRKFIVVSDGDCNRDGIVILVSKSCYVARVMDLFNTFQNRADGLIRSRGSGSQYRQDCVCHDDRVQNYYRKYFSHPYPLLLLFEAPPIRTATDRWRPVN